MNSHLTVTPLCLPVLSNYELKPYLPWIAFPRYFVIKNIEKCNRKGCLYPPVPAIGLWFQPNFTATYQVFLGATLWRKGLFGSQFCYSLPWRYVKESGMWYCQSYFIPSQEWINACMLVPCFPYFYVVQYPFPGKWCHPQQAGLSNSINAVKIILHRYAIGLCNLDNLSSILGNSRLLGVDHKTNHHSG